jgi:hypothetical protein
MKTAIMQPYFLPYIGYFQLIAAVDKFIIYDRIKYTKKGWINRNRMLLNGSDTMFSLPLKKGSDALEVVEREIADDFAPEKLLAQFAGAYRRAPHFEPTFELLRSVLMHGERNLFGFIQHSLRTVCGYLSIGTPIQVSSSLPFDNALKAHDKVLAVCEAAGARTYVNPIGGTELYSEKTFAERGIELRFLRSRPLEYPQFGAPFVPWLSIVDVMMFNPVGVVIETIQNQFDLL